MIKGGHHEQARQNRAAVMELLGRFNAISRSQIAAVLFGGNVRAANRVLLSLVRTGRVYRYAVEPRGEYIYGLRKGPTGQTEHHLAIAGLYSALVRTVPPGRSLHGAGNVQLMQGLITDLLVTTGDLAVLTEVHLGTAPFGSKLDRYAAYRASREWESAPWWAPGMRVIVWLVGPRAAVPWLERLTGPHKAAGMRVAVSAMPDALAAPWRALHAAVGDTAGLPAGLPAAPSVRWKLPPPLAQRGGRDG